MGFFSEDEGKLTIRQFQRYAQFKEAGHEHEFLLKFMEECGEMARAISHSYPHAEGNNIRNTMEEEFCDVMLYLCALASLYEVDIEKWIPVKERETDARYGTDYFDRFFADRPC